MSNKEDKNEQKELEKKITALLNAAERAYPTIPQLMLRSFIHGVFLALGTTVGLSIVITLITFILSQLREVPVVSGWIEILNIRQYLPEQ